VGTTVLVSTIRLSKNQTFGLVLFTFS